MAERSGPAFLAKGNCEPSPLSVCPGVLGGASGFSCEMVPTGPTRQE